MSPMRCLIVVALSLFVSGVSPRALVSTQQSRGTAEIRGRVLYQNGKVAPRALVAASREGQLSGRILSASSNDEGRFVIKGVESGAHYDLCASKQSEGYLDPYFLPLGLSTGGQCKKITASAASEVDLVLAPKGGTLEGEVRDARNLNAISNGKVVIYRPLKLLREQWVLVNPRDATWVPSVEAAVDDNGHFKILGLPTGRYFLKVEVPGRKTWYFHNQVSHTVAQ
ncbi:MAG: carboxypeptidase-like regulatory domain-containing protein, partial [bacterium]